MLYNRSFTFGSILFLFKPLLFNASRLCRLIWLVTLTVTSDIIWYQMLLRCLLINFWTVLFTFTCCTVGSACISQSSCCKASIFFVKYSPGILLWASNSDNFSIWKCLYIKCTTCRYNILSITKMKIWCLVHWESDSLCFLSSLVQWKFDRLCFLHSSSSMIIWKPLVLKF